MSELSNLIVTITLGAGVPAIVALLWRISMALQVLTVRVDALEKRHQEAHR